MAFTWIGLKYKVTPSVRWTDNHIIKSCHLPYVNWVCLKLLNLCCYKLSQWDRRRHRLSGSTRLHPGGLEWRVHWSHQKEAEWGSDCEIGTREEAEESDGGPAEGTWSSGGVCNNGDYLGINQTNPYSLVVLLASLTLLLWCQCLHQ